MNEKIEKHVEKLEKAAHSRLWPLRETVMLRLRQIPHILRIVEWVTKGLVSAAGAPPDPQLLGESVVRAEVRAAGVELRHLQEHLSRVALRLKGLEDAQGATLEPADRRLCEFALAQRREMMRLAVRFERRVGPAPERGQEDRRRSTLAATTPLQRPA
ncbi:MAG: hypothetical protein ABJC13_17330 [Acidobacteriota bacterium]